MTLVPPLASPEKIGVAASDGTVLLVPFDAEMTYSLLLRLHRLMALPAVVAPMLTFPEVVVIIIVSL